MIKASMGVALGGYVFEWEDTVAREIIIKQIDDEQAGGTKESRGEKINRLLKEKHECQWEPGGSMTQNENANI